jgi:hypothetical protein
MSLSRLLCRSRGSYRGHVRRSRKPAAVTIEDVIRDFATTGSTLPRASMQWALDHWDEAAPALIAALDRYSSGEDRSEDMESVVFFAVHLLGQKDETRAFEALCRLMREAQACDAALGDAETETLPQIIVSTFDGNPGPLKAVIEDRAADEFVRHGALMALAYLARTGRIPHSEMQAYLRHLYAEMQPREESPVWVGWVEAVAALGYAEYAEMAEALFEKGFIEPFVMGVEHFRGDLQLTLSDPGSMAGFAGEHIQPFGDAIETLSNWYFFTDAYKKDEARLAADRAAEERLNRFGTGFPYLNEFRHVGRNDPCPCGSGSKYKKCCLDKAALSLSAAQ